MTCNTQLPQLLHLVQRNADRRRPPFHTLRRQEEQDDVFMDADMFLQVGREQGRVLAVPPHVCHEDSEPMRTDMPQGKAFNMPLYIATAASIHTHPCHMQMHMPPNMRAAAGRDTRLVYYKYISASLRGHGVEAGYEAGDPLWYAELAKALRELYVDPDYRTSCIHP